MPAAPHARHVRALALAGASFGLGLAGHVQAGGAVGATGSMTFAAAFCGFSAWIYAWRRLSAPAVTAVLLVNQLVVHVALALGPAHPGAATAAAQGMAGMPGMPGMAGMAGMAADGSCGDAGGGATASAMALLPTGWMLAAHLVASALAAAVIVTVEAVWLGLFALARWIARAALIAFTVPPLPSRAAATVDTRPPSWTSRRIGARPGRGPPRPSNAW